MRYAIHGHDSSLMYMSNSGLHLIFQTWITDCPLWEKLLPDSNGPAGALLAWNRLRSAARKRVQRARQPLTLKEGTASEFLSEERSLRSSKFVNELSEAEDGVVINVKGHTGAAARGYKLPGDLEVEGWEMMAASQTFQSTCVGEPETVGLMLLTPSDQTDHQQPGPSDSADPADPAGRSHQAPRPVAGVS